MQPNDQIDVCLEKQYHRFRWKSEVKSNIGDKISSHGNYLTGSIKLPSNLNFPSYKLELSLVPSLQSDQNVFFTNPYLLHLTHPDTYHPLNDINKESWKLIFDIDVKNGELLRHHNGLTHRFPIDPMSPYIKLGK